MTLRITFSGQDDPAMIPVRKLDKSYSAKFGRDSSAMNIVGTPYSDVHLCAATAFRVNSGSKPALGITIVAPCEVHARLPMGADERSVT
jgi:hypothetical protein